MTKPEFCDDGYPTESTLRTIRTWKGSMKSLFEFVRAGWEYPDRFKIRRRKVTISTGGWFANEILVAAMMKHTLLWAFCWVSSRRGGHYEFELPEEK